MSRSDVILDGSRGEGGGALLRQALGLAIHSRRRIRIVRVRANRPRPGLRPQHLKAIEAASLLCGARVEGATLGSQEILFCPGPKRSGDWRIDTGTAGAVTLVVQAILVPALALPGSARFTLTGGTDTTWAPPADYVSRVTLAALSGFGSGTLSVTRRGYYPAGGGYAVASFEGVGVPGPLTLEHRARATAVRGLSHAASSLRERRVAERQACAAERELAPTGLPVEIAVRYGEATSPGSGITVWTEGTSPPLGGSALGAQGRRAEAVGAAAARELRTELDSGAVVDRHLADQLVPFLALAGGRLRTSEITGHTRSNVYVARELLGVEIAIDEGRRELESPGL